MSKGGKKNRGAKGNRNISMLDQHQRHGKALRTPFNQVPDMHLMSCVNGGDKMCQMAA